MITYQGRKHNFSKKSLYIRKFKISAISLGGKGEGAKLSKNQLALDFPLCEVKSTIFLGVSYAMCFVFPVLIFFSAFFLPCWSVVAVFFYSAHPVTVLLFISGIRLAGTFCQNRCSWVKTAG